MSQFISYPEAVSLVMNAASPLLPQTVAVDKACGLVLAEDVFAKSDFPRFRNSQMDGYGIRTADLATAATFNVHPQLVSAGIVFKGRLPAATAVKIMTGALVPKDIDAVIRKEDATQMGNAVSFVITPRAGDFIREAGGDFRKSDLLLPKGRRLTPYDVALLINAGLAKVRCHPKPKVAVLSTGDEIVPLGKPLSGAKIYNSNLPMLQALLQAAGYEVVLAASVTDSEKILAAKLTAAKKSADVIITTGGVSVGDLDIVSKVLTSIGFKEIFWKVKQRPAKPLLFGTLAKAGKHRIPVFGLPGNPYSTAVCFEVYVKPALRKLSGVSDFENIFETAVLKNNVKKVPSLTTFLAGSMTTDGGRTLIETSNLKQGSHIISSVSQATALLMLPEDRESFDAGEAVQILRLLKYEDA